MSNDNSKVPMQATPHGTLLEQIMDPCQPKNEREWAASREIERLTALTKEYRENGDRLMRVADEYKAEIERLNQHAVDVYKLNRESYLKMQQEIDALKAEQEAWRKFTDMANTTCDRKDAALRVALSSLDACENILPVGYGLTRVRALEAITTIKAAL